MNHYKLPSTTRARFLTAVTWLCEHKDEHFGNGRLVRNVFEDAVRHLANRIAEVSPITKDLLTRFEADDLQFENVPASELEKAPSAQFSVQCEKCHRESVVQVGVLAQRVKCTCGHRFRAEWGTLVR